MQGGDEHESQNKEKDRTLDYQHREEEEEELRSTSIEIQIPKCFLLMRPHTLQQKPIDRKAGKFSALVREHKKTRPVKPGPQQKGKKKAKIKK